MQKVVSNLIVSLENLTKRVYNIEFIIDNYQEWKNEKDEFKQYVLDVVEKSAKDGANSNVSSK